MDVCGVQRITGDGHRPDFGRSRELREEIGQLVVGESGAASISRCSAVLGSGRRLIRSVMVAARAAGEEVRLRERPSEEVIAGPVRGGAGGRVQPDCVELLSDGVLGGAGGDEHVVGFLAFRPFRTDDLGDLRGVPVAADDQFAYPLLVELACWADRGRIQQAYQLRK